MSAGRGDPLGWQSVSLSCVHSGGLSLPEKRSRLVGFGSLAQFSSQPFPIKKKRCATSEESGVSRARIPQGKGVAGVVWCPRGQCGPEKNTSLQKLTWEFLRSTPMWLPYWGALIWRVLINESKVCFTH